MVESDAAGDRRLLSDELELNCRVMVAELGNMLVQEHTRRRRRWSRYQEEERDEEGCDGDHHITLTLCHGDHCCPFGRR